MILTRRLASKGKRGIVVNSFSLATATAPTTATATATVAAGIAAAATRATGVTATATAAALTAALPLVLPLPRKGIGADIAKRRFHRIRLAGTGWFVAACVAAIAPLAV